MMLLALLFSVQTTATDQVDYESLKKEIARLDKSYYEKGVSLISDEEYDKLLKKFQALEKKLYPDRKATIVREVQVDGKKIKHQHFVGSLNKVKSADELERWLNNFPDGDNFIIQPKIDGMSVVCHYEKGKLVSAATRGDGTEGNDISSILPDKYKTINANEKLILRGEIFISLEDFSTLGGQFTTPRSATVAIVRANNQLLRNKLTINFFEITNLKLTPSDMLDYMKKLKCNVIGYRLMTSTQILENFVEIEDQYQNDKTDNDGFVVKHDKFYPSTAENPTWAMAYKFASQSQWTKVVAIDWQISVHGKLKPVAIFEPVYIDNCEISRATLYNWKNVESKKITIGSKIKVTRAGKTIPKIVANIPAVDVNQPLQCPYCNEKTDIQGIDLICTNQHCVGRIKRQLCHFFSKDGIYVPGLNKRIVNVLVDKWQVKSVSDVYKFPKSNWKKLEKEKGIGLKTINKVIIGLEKSKVESVDKIALALALPNVGRKTAKKLNHITLKNLPMDHKKMFVNLQKLGFKSLENVKLD